MKISYIYQDSRTSWAVFTPASEESPDDSGESLASVFHAVRKIFIDIFGRRVVNSRTVLSVIPDFGTPITIREHTVIFLCGDRTDILRNIYQFAHELCHFVIPRKVCETYRWFEETLCQAMSWYILGELLKRRTSFPIKQIECLYEEINGYVSRDQRQRTPLPNHSLGAFLAANLSHLQADCYDREMNRAIAYELYPLFMKNPELWKIVPHLHRLRDGMSLSDAISYLIRRSRLKKDVAQQLLERLHN